MASEGRLTLQIPTLYIGSLPNDIIDLPDEWFCILKGGRPCVGKEQGFLYLTYKGWIANRNDIKKAFMASKYKRGTWQDFKNHVKNDFKERHKKVQKQINYHQTKVNQLKNIKI